MMSAPSSNRLWRQVVGAAPQLRTTAASTLCYGGSSSATSSTRLAPTSWRPATEAARSRSRSFSSTSPTTEDSSTASASSSTAFFSEELPTFSYRVHRGFRTQASLLVDRPPLRYTEPDFMREWREFELSWKQRTGNADVVNDNLVYMKMPNHFLATEEELEKKARASEVTAEEEESGKSELELMLEQSGLGFDASAFAKKGAGPKKRKAVQEAQVDDAPQSMTKSVEGNLWLVVRYRGSSIWTFPRISLTDEHESMRELLQSLCEDQLGGFQPHFVGRCPFTFEKFESQRQVFYYRAHATPEMGNGWDSADVYRRGERRQKGAEDYVIVRYLGDSTFLTELYPNGKKRAAASLRDLLLTCNIGHIYCSPFLRVLQTVGPFAKAASVPIKVDYRLTESILDPKFQEKPDIELTADMRSEFGIREENVLRSWVGMGEPRLGGANRGPMSEATCTSPLDSGTEGDVRMKALRFPESSEQIYRRVHSFVRDISFSHDIDFRTDVPGSKNVLVVTHMDVVNTQIALWQAYRSHWSAGANRAAHQPSAVGADHEAVQSEGGAGSEQHPLEVSSREGDPAERKRLHDDFFARLIDHPPQKAFGLYRMGCVATFSPDSGELIKLNEGFDSEDGDDMSFPSMGNGY